MTLSKQKTTIKLLAICGSLRGNSSNHSVINTASALVGGRAKVIMYEGLSALPHFDDRPNPPKEVIDFRKQLQDADGVLICTPEYAFGVPGALKNAFDWTVGTGEFVNKPVALITAATGGDKAHASLLLTLSALSAKVPDEGTLLISFIKSKLNEHGGLKSTPTINAIQSVVDSLIKTIAETALVETEQYQ